MSLTPAVQRQLIAAARPVLMIDTCSVLDIMRDVTRETSSPASLEAAIMLVTAAEAAAPSMLVLMSDQVRRELTAHESPVEAEAIAKLLKFEKQIKRVHDTAVVFGATGTLTTTHLSNHVASAKAVFGRWKAVALTVTESSAAISKAYLRVAMGTAPASPGNQSMKDCAILESYLEAMSQLRAGGYAGKAVLLSSNTADYGKVGAVRSPIDVDLAALAVEFATDFAFAKHSLGV